LEGLGSAKISLAGFTKKKVSLRYIKSKDWKELKYGNGIKFILKMNPAFKC
jgi:hypothetical protein